ncbi:MAG: zinc ribbon domain-containing protein [Pseudomonadota bacterium]
MALIRCPNCQARISNKVTVCPHCEYVLGTDLFMESEKMATRRYKRQRYHALNWSYVGLTLLVFGAIWWWLVEPQGWVMPPPLTAVTMVIIGAILYTLARGWMLWLKMQRSRSG